MLGIWEQENIVTISIRDYMLAANGEPVPLKNGVTLSLDVWQAMMRNVTDIDADVCMLEKQWRRNNSDGASMISIEDLTT